MNPEQSQSFTRFYSAYPRKTAKGRAEKNWAHIFAKLSPVERELLTTQMVDAIVIQTRARKDREAKGEWLPDWPHPGTWLSDKRWLDQVGNFTKPKMVSEKKCGCGATANVFPFAGKYICQSCYLKATDLDILRDAYKAHGLALLEGETIAQHQQRMVRIARDKWHSRFVKKPAAAKPRMRNLHACALCNGEGRYKEFDERNSPWIPCGKCGGQRYEREPGCDDE